jgi:hypothetical protein
MAKIRTAKGQFTHTFFCPGCKCGHGINTEPNKPNGMGGFVPVWTFNGDFEKPTIRASVLVNHGNDGRNGRCHSFVTDGNIQFLDDCTHELKGQTVPLEDF